jgi:hypothetical protein
MPIRRKNQSPIADPVGDVGGYDGSERGVSVTVEGG